MQVQQPRCPFRAFDDPARLFQDGYDVPALHFFAPGDAAEIAGSAVGRRSPLESLGSAVTLPASWDCNTQIDEYRPSTTRVR
jgi:hypothetical protein